MKPHFVSLFYILDFELYNDTLFRMLCEEKQDLPCIQSWLQKSFDTFKRLVIEEAKCKHYTIDMKAFCQADWNTYVVNNDHVTKQIQKWMQWFMDIDFY